MSNITYDTKTQEFFPITLFGTDFQAPVGEYIRFKGKVLAQGEKTAQESNQGFQIRMDYSDTEPPVSYMELFWPYEHGGFDSGVQKYDQKELEKFITPTNFSEITKLSTILYGLYQDGKPVTVTVTVAKHNAEPEIEAVPF